jgi:processive 1,2-diacylglycerol beta-glucosyltransferase
MPVRVLVLSASVGAGHVRAAQAVELALRETAPDATVKNVDVLTLTNAPFRKLYGEAYLDLVNKAPHVLGFFYDHMDKPRGADSKRDKLRLLVERLNLASLIDVLESEKWDAIVNTHFMPAAIIASMRKKRPPSLRTPQMTVTTDFETHRLWVNQPCDHYTTATDEGAAYLHHWGVPSDDITVTGIPIHPVFAKPKPREAAMKHQGITGGRPVVLQLAGGFGVGPVAEIFGSILEVQTPIELIVVTGKNAAAKKKLEAAKVDKRHRVKVLGFTDQMDELMAAADIVISKPGGLTTSETLARGAAMVVVNPIPGQESRNSDYLLENGAAIKINNLPTLAMKLDALLGDSKRLQQLRDNAKRIGRPQAAFDVAARAMRLAGAGVGV